MIPTTNKSIESKLTKEDIGYCYEATLLYFEGVEGTTQLNYQINAKHILLGQKILDMLKQEFK